MPPIDPSKKPISFVKSKPVAQPTIVSSPAPRVETMAEKITQTVQEINPKGVDEIVEVMDPALPEGPTDSLAEQLVEMPVDDGGQPIADAQAALPEILEQPVVLAIIQPVVENTPVEAVSVPMSHTEKAILKNFANQEFAKAASNLVKANPGVGIFFSELFDYVAAMSPQASTSEDDGMRWQSKLYKLMVKVIQYSGDNHNVLLLCFLNYIHQHLNGCFDWSYRNRYMENISLSAPERKAFTAMTLFFTEMCVQDHNERFKRSKIIFASTNASSIQNIVGENAIQRVRTALRLN